MRVVLLALVGLAAVAVVTGAAPLRRTAGLVFLALALYALLKMTGVLEAITPDRSGVF